MKLKTELNKMIKKSSNIFLSGHKDLDLDAIGSVIGMNLITRKKKKRTYIILDDTKHEASVKKVLTKFEKQFKFIKSKDINKYKNDKSLLIILDTNKASLVQGDNIPDKFNNIFIIDHHDQDKNTIKTKYKYINNKKSSVCEIIANLLKELHINIEEKYATLLLAGITLDTNNFTLKTTSNTFKTAYYLTQKHADPMQVQFLLKQDIKEFINLQKILAKIKIVNKNIAIVKGLETEKYRREDLAKLADTLLQFNNIEASFAVGPLEKEVIGISARSIGNINVSEIMSKFEGGGNKTEAATRIKSSDLNKVEKDLVNTLRGL